MSEQVPTDIPTHIDLYWRPGCGFCSSLRRQLDDIGIDRVEHNIWDDPSLAGTVREYAYGNETVPTVVVGGVGFVNPSADELTAHLAANAPHLLPDGYEAPEPGLAGRTIGRICR